MNSETRLPVETVFRVSRLLHPPLSKLLIRIAGVLAPFAGRENRVQDRSYLRSARRIQKNFAHLLLNTRLIALM